MDTQQTSDVPTANEALAAASEQTRKTALWPSIGLAPHLAVVFVLLAVVLFTFCNTLQPTGFALDNKFIILEDPRLRDAKRENIHMIFTQDYWWPKAVSGLYRPLTTLSYLFNYSILGNADSARGYHWINFILHWLNAVLVYFMVLALMEKLWPALFTAALFATHPIVTESVTNIIGRADLFATAAVAAGLLCYAKSTTVDGWRKALWLLGLAVITTVGLFCKESAFVIFPVMVLYDLTYRFPTEVFKKAWVTLIGYLTVLVPIAAWFGVRSCVFQALRPPEKPFVDNPLVGAEFWTARLTAIKVIGKYFWLLLWPETLSCDYSYNQIPLASWHFNSGEDLKAIIALISVIVVILLGIRNFHRNKPLFFFIFFFFLTFLPTSNLMPTAWPITDAYNWTIGSIMAERFMYLPSIGYAGCVVIAIYAFCRWLIPQLDISAWAQRIWLQVIARTALSLIVVAYGVRAFLRNPDWENDEKLWAQAVVACPNSFKTHKSLAYALYEKDPEYKNIDRIIDEGEKAVQITDKTQIVFLHLGAYYRIKGDLLAQRTSDGTLIASPASLPWYQKSVDTLQRAVPLDHEFNDDNRAKELRRGRHPDQIPDIGNHEIYWNLGLSYMRLGQYRSALDSYLYMRHLSPGNPDAYMSIASVYIAAGKSEDAAIALLQALLLDSNRHDALDTLVSLYRQIDREGCSVVFQPGQQAPKLNADCPLVRSHICMAYYGLVQVFLDAKQYESAEQTKQAALRNYPCSPEQFQKLFPDSTTPASMKK